MKNIVHIDLNAFFAQCEENCNPKYKNLPLCVGYDGKRGVVATSNYIARSKGVILLCLYIKLSKFVKT